MLDMPEIARFREPESGSQIVVKEPHPRHYSIEVDGDEVIKITPLVATYNGTKSSVAIKALIEDHKRTRGLFARAQQIVEENGEVVS